MGYQAWSKTPPKSSYVESGLFYKAWAVTAMVMPTSKMKGLSLILKV